MSSDQDVRSPSPIVYIGPARRIKTENCAVRLTHHSGRVITASKIVQGLIDCYLDAYIEELSTQSSAR